MTRRESSLSSLPPREVKLVILGSGGVGKTSLGVQFVQRVFVDEYDPTIEDGGYRKQTEVDGEYHLLDILDLPTAADDDPFSALRELYMRDGEGFLFVYSIAAQSTVGDLPDFVEMALRVKGMEAGELPLVFCGNKCDLSEDQRVVETRQGEELAQRYGDAGFFETSAKTRINVDEAFCDLVRRVMAKRQPPPTKKELRKQRAAEKDKRAREKEARRTAAVEAARPQTIPETVLPRLPTRSQMGSDLRELFERANTGAVGDQGTCDIEFIFPLSATGGAAAVNVTPSGSDTDEAVGGIVGGTAILRAHKVVVFAHAGGMLRQVYAGAAPADARGVSKVYMNPDDGDISLQACRHLLSFVYSGELPAAGDDNADDSTDDNDAGSLWGSWKPFAKELMDAATRYDMTWLHIALKGHKGGNTEAIDGAASLNVMHDAEFLADVEFILRDEKQSSEKANASKKKGGIDGDIVIPSHQAVLRARSPYFESLFSDERFREGAHAAAAARAPGELDSRISIPMDLADCCEGALRRGLAYLYEEHDAALENELMALSSEPSSASVSTDDGEDASRVVMDLWRLARRWEVERLCLVVERVLARSFTNDTVCFFAHEAAPGETSPGRPDLLSSCIDYVSYRYESVSQGGAGFAELPGDVRAKMQSSRRQDRIWDDPQAGGGAKLKKRLGVLKASLFTD